MTTARNGNVESLKILLAHGADVQATETRTGQTALMWAAAEGHAAAVRTLVELRANVAARSRSGLSAFLFAVRAGRIDAVRELLAAGVSVDEAVRPPPAEAPAAGAPPSRYRGESAVSGMSAFEPGNRQRPLRSGRRAS